MNPLVRGSLGGLAATITMTVVMFAGKRLGLLHRPPPKEITQRVGQKIGIPRHDQPEPAALAATAVAHLSYGMAAGVVYDLIRGLLPKQPLLAGLLYGTVLWAVGYLGVMPGLGLYPEPSEVTPSQTAVMIVGHEVYGSTLAQVESLLS